MFAGGVKQVCVCVSYYRYVKQMKQRLVPLARRREGGKEFAGDGKQACKLFINDIFITSGQMKQVRIVPGTVAEGETSLWFG